MTARDGWTLAKARERDASFAPGGGGWSPAVGDRRRLLALVDQQHARIELAARFIELAGPYLRHDAGCPNISIETGTSRCFCGLDALFRALDGAGKQQ